MATVWIERRLVAILDEAQRAALQAIDEQGPIPAIQGGVRWRLVDLMQWVWEEFRLAISQQTLSREGLCCTDRLGAAVGLARPSGIGERALA